MMGVRMWNWLRRRISIISDGFSLMGQPFSGILKNGKRLKACRKTVAWRGYHEITG